MKPLLILLTTTAAFAAADHRALGADEYHSPYDVVFSHDGRLLAVSAADGQTVAGFSVYQHAETPGLGGEIEKPWFQQNCI